MTGTTTSADMDMELGVPSMLQPWLHSKKSQTGLTQTMKGMMKSVTGNLVRFEHIKHEERQLAVQIIKEMNTMELFYREHPYSENNPKPHLEKEVMTLYNANKKRIESAGIQTSGLKQFMKNSERKELELQKKYGYGRTPTPHTNDYNHEYRPRNRDAESPRMHEKESGRGRDHHHQPTSHNDKQVSGDPPGSIPVAQKDPVLDRNGRDSPDSEEDFDVQNHYYNANGTHSQYEYCI